MQTGSENSSADPLAEVRSVSSLLVRVAEELKAELARAAESCGLPVHLARAVLSLDEPIPMRELADRLACDRSYITGLADGLEDRGLVVRIPGADRRIKLLQLTDEGRALHDELNTVVTANSAILRGLESEERATLRALLLKVLQAEDVSGPAEAISA